MGASDGTQPCTKKSKAKPSGDCTPQRYKELDNDVSSKCKSNGVKRKCESGTDCASSLYPNLAKNQACADARQQIMTECFNGGDPGHDEALQNALRAVANCQKIIANECQPDPTPVPDPTPTPAPAPSPAPSTQDTAPSDQGASDDDNQSTSPSFSLPTLDPVQQLALQRGISYAEALAICIMLGIILLPVGA